MEEELETNTQNKKQRTKQDNILEKFVASKEEGKCRACAILEAN